MKTVNIAIREHITAESGIARNAVYLIARLTLVNVLKGSRCDMLKVGDTIKCHDKDEMIDLMHELEKENIETDFMYEKDGVKGLWLVVVKAGAE